MRKTADHQLPLTPTVQCHSHIAELEEISRILDKNPEIAELAHTDLVRGVRTDTGAEAKLTADQVVRATILYQSNRWSFDELAFELSYNVAYRKFCRLGFGQHPSRSTLNRDIGRIGPEAWETIHRVLIGYAKDIGVEDGKKVRTDCTVMKATIHEPTDSSLLSDCMRVLTRQLLRASDVVNVSYSNHCKRAKRRAFEIQNAKSNKERVPLYLDLLKVTKMTLGYAKRTVAALKLRKHPLAEAHRSALQETIDLTIRVIAQTERRIVHGESVPAGEKIVSIFEPHTDIIRKDRRETLYGHKLCLSAGASNLITDCVVLDGNPADSTLTVEMMKRHIEILDQVPEQVAFDGAFASIDNLAALKTLGIDDNCFTKARWAKITDMVKNSWTYKKLRRFRAGVEGIISFLKRAFGVDRCRRKGLRSFKVYALSSVVSANLLTLARHALK
ncbi:MAG: ISNCY family transposase [Proteobacteria bacterium]|nr:MAG: ISNCY family transposase [Pseudomonadota bacterium]